MNRPLRPARASSGRSRSGGFTLLELLAVIAVIGVLAAILIPTTARVRESSRKAKTRAQFSQWIQGIENFRQEYGYYPDLNGSAGGQPVALKVNDGTSIFYELLAGTDRLATPSKLSVGATAPAVAALAQNKKSVQFYTFHADELRLDGSGNVAALRDAFEGEEIVVVLDTDLNGVLPKADFLNLAGTPGFTGVTIVENGDSTVLNLRTGVAIYSRGKGEEFNQIVTSWR